MITNTLTGGDAATVVRPMSFKAERWAAYLVANGIPWPRLESGALALDDETFRQMAKRHPKQVGPIRELRHTLGQLRLNELAVGVDGRNRCLLSPYRARTGRNQPSNSRFIFGPSDWRLTSIECDEQTKSRKQCDRGCSTDKTRRRQQHIGRKHMATSPLNQNAAESSPGFEAAFCRTADRFRNEMGPADYRHVVLGLLSLRHLSDLCHKHNAVATEDPDDSNAANDFMVPPEARWTHLQAHAGQPTISKLVDDAMAAIERDNPQLKDALYRNYDPASLSKCRLGELIDLISTIPHTDESGDSTNLLARVFEHSVIHFSDADSGSSGEYYTPSSVMGLIAEYAPC